MREQIHINKAVMFCSVVFILLLVTPLVSAFQFDNVITKEKVDKKFTVGTKVIEKKDFWDLYPPLSVKNLFGFGQTLANVVLEEHTTTCSYGCSSVFTIETTTDSPLIEAVQFYRVYPDNSRKQWKIRNYAFELWDDERWVPYTIGTVMPSGTYTLRLSGEKKAEHSIDWVIKTQGKWLTEWSTWGSTSGYTVNAHGVTMTEENNIATGNRFGDLFNATKGGTLINITKATVSTNPPTDCKLYTSAYALLASGNFSGNDCNLNYNLTRGLLYITDVGKTVGPFDYRILQADGNPDAPPNYPIANPDITWLNGTENGVIISPRSMVALISIQTNSNSTVTLNIPLNNSGVKGGQVTLNGTASVVGGATLVNMSLWDNSTGTFKINQTNAVLGVVNSSNFFQNYTNGTIIWSVSACDSDGDCGMAPNQSFSVDGIAPVVNITYPFTTIAYKIRGTNDTINWTTSDAISGLNACILTYNGANRTVTCSGNTSQYNFTSGLNVTAILYANDTAGNEISTTRTWNYTLFQDSVVFHPSAYVGSTEFFELNFTSTQGDTPAFVTLVYNGTEYSTSFNSLGGNQYQAKTNLYVTNLTSSGENRTFFWNVTYGSGAISTTRSYNQTLLSLTIDNCSQANQDVILNFTLNDEDTRTALNGSSPALNATIEVLGNLYSLGTTSLVATFNRTYNVTNNALVCIQSGVLNQTSYTLNYQTKYYANTYATEYKYAQNITLTNSTIPQNIALYDLLSTRSTVFRVIIHDSATLPITGALVDLQRQYLPLNQYLSVETPITDNEGNAVMHVVLSDVVYTLVVSTNNRQQARFTDNRFSCPNAGGGQDCFKLFNQPYDSSQLYDFTTYQNIQYSISYNKTSRLMSLAYLSLNGTNLLVNLTALVNDGYGNNTVCTNAQTGASGTLTCSIPQSYGNQTIIAYLFTDNALAGKFVANNQYTAQQIFGNSRSIFAAIMFSTLAFLFIGNPATLVLGGIIGMAMGGALFYIDGFTFFSAGSFFIWFFVAGSILFWQLARKESQS